MGRQYLIRYYLENADSPVVVVIPYYELTENETAISAANVMDGDPANYRKMYRRTIAIGSTLSASTRMGRPG